MSYVAMLALLLVGTASCSGRSEEAPTAAATTQSPGGGPKHVVLIGDANTWYFDRPMAAHRVMENLLATIPFLDKQWQGAKVHNLAISGTSPHDWIVKKKCIEGGLGKRYPINQYCDEIDFLAQGITKVVPKPDVVIVNLGLHSSGLETPKQTVDDLTALKKYLGTITPKVILAAPFPMPPGPTQAFVAAVRQEMIDRGILDWDFPRMEFQNGNRNIHLTERARARHGALMAIWLVYGSPKLERSAPPSKHAMKKRSTGGPAHSQGTAPSR